MIKAILLTVPRSGSEVLVECLDSHPDIKCESEVILPFMHNLDLATHKMQDFFKKEEEKNKKRMTPRKVICFKGMYMHLGEKSWKYITKNQIKIIHLIRENQFNRAISDEFNHRKTETGRSHHSKKKERAIKLHIEKDKLLAQIKEYEDMVRNMKNYLKTNKVDHITVYYEEMFKNSNHKNIDLLPTKIQNRISRYFNIPSRPMSTTLVKQNHKPISQYIKNWTEIKSLSDTKTSKLYTRCFSTLKYSLSHKFKSIGKSLRRCLQAIYGKLS